MLELSDDFKLKLSLTTEYELARALDVLEELHKAVGGPCLKESRLKLRTVCANAAPPLPRPRAGALQALQLIQRHPCLPRDVLQRERARQREEAEAAGVISLVFAEPQTTLGILHVVGTLRHSAPPESQILPRGRAS